MTLKKENIKRIIFVLIIIFALFALTGCGSDMDDQPLNNFGDEKDIIGWIFVYPIGWIMSKIGSLFNGSYGLAIIVTTVIVRFAAWPIYAGQTNMSLNMQMAKPDLDRVNAKYNGRTDPESMQRKQQEIMAIYKKYNVSFKSCLSMPIQMGLFIGLTRAMTRIAIEGGALTLANFNLFGFDLRGSLLSGDYGIGNQVFTGVLVLLVAVTSFGQQFYLNKRQQSAVKTQEQTQQMGPSMDKMMKVMMYGFPIMLAVMAAGSTAFALYWTIGNTCSFITMFINKRVQDKKLAAHKESLKNNVDIFDKEEKSYSNDTQDVVVESDTTEIVDTNVASEKTIKRSDDIIDIE